MICKAHTALTVIIPCPRNSDSIVAIRARIKVRIRVRIRIRPTIALNLIQNLILTRIPTLIPKIKFVYLGFIRHGIITTLTDQADNNDKPNPVQYTMVTKK